MVAGNGIPNNLHLKFPTDVVLDADGFLYIADKSNHRIIRVRHDKYDCIPGCTDKSGSASNELNTAYAVRFDSKGNLYVADEFNHRIQKFDLSLDSCETSTTVVSTVERTTINSFVTSQQNQLITTEQTLITSTTYSLQQTSPSPSFFLANCPNSTHIGLYCNISNSPCEMLQPCQNNEICNNTDRNHHGYVCVCSSGFDGVGCLFDYQLCKPNTCWNNGTCTDTPTFNCTCAPGWEGDHCERKTDYCYNITCHNRGVCRPLLLDYLCECFGDSYFGRHCESTAKKIIIYKIVSKSVSYIAIIAMASVAMFVIVMDILKYCFGIDPTREELERIRREKREKRRKPVIQRFIYVNAPPSSNEPTSTVEETAV